MTARELPPWSVRLRAERVQRLWSQKVMAARLRAAADAPTRASLPPAESIQRYIRAYEAGHHAPGDLYAELYSRAFGLTRAALFGAAAGPPHPAQKIPPLPQAADADGLTAWITATNTSDARVDDLGQRVALLAEEHAIRPPDRLLADVLALHQQLQSLLRSGRQRLHQTRELYRLDGDLLAHIALLLGDLHRNTAAAAHGSAARLYADEAGATPAIALSVQAKTARWRRQFATSADLARQGYESSPATPVRVLLASQEATAAALLGDAPRARQALDRAEAAAVVIHPDSGMSAWSCSRPRQALFALSVAIRFQDATAALRAASMADTAWSSGVPRVMGTWAQVRLGTGIARTIAGDLDGAFTEVIPVMTLAPEYRMATITAYATQLDKRLQQRRFQRDPTAADIRALLREFNAQALPRPAAGVS
jgi:hypothetical protein